MGNATACARVIIEEMIARGVRDVVLAPGSRSAPLAYECFEADRINRAIDLRHTKDLLDLISRLTLGDVNSLAPE